MTGWWEKTSLRTFEPANDRLDAARRAGRGGCEADGLVGAFLMFLYVLCGERFTIPA